MQDTKEAGTESTKPVTGLALFTLLRNIDPEGVMAYTSVRELEAMAGQQVIAIVETFRDEMRVSHADLKSEIGKTNAALAEVRAEVKAEIAGVKAEVAALGGYKKMLWALIVMLGSALTVGAITAIVRLVFNGS